MRAEKLVETAISSGVHDAHGLLLDCRASHASDLLISCSGIVPDGRVIYGMRRTFAATNLAKLFLCDSRNEWYYSGIDGLTSSFDETVGLVRDVVTLIKPERVHAVGTSAGAYMAIALAAMNGYAGALAFSPQVDLRKSWRDRHGETRWAEYMERIYERVGEEGSLPLHDLIKDRASRESAFHIVYGTGDALDEAAAHTLSGAPGVSLHPIETDNHAVSAYLHGRGELAVYLELVGLQRASSGEALPLD